MHRPRLETALRICLAVFMLYTIGRFGIDQIRPPGMIPNDFRTFPHACERLDAGTAVYQPDDPSPFKYSPTFLLAFRYSYCLLPLTASWIVWAIACAVAFALATAWLWSAALPWERLSGRSLALLVAAFGVFHWHGFIEHYSYGQGDVFLFALFIGSVALLSSSWRWAEPAAALLFAMNLLTKPQSALLLAFLALSWRPRALALTGAATLVLLASPALVLGPTRLLEFFHQWRAVLAVQSVEFMTGNLNQSAAASIVRWAGHPENVYLATSLTVLVALASVVLTVSVAHLKRRLPGRDRRHYALIACYCLQLYALASPLSWRWLTFVWLPIGVTVAATTWELRGRAGFAIRALLAAFALNGTLLQTFVAHAVGIHEVDDLSRAGLYTVGNVLLFAAAALACDYSRKPNEVSS